MLKMKEPVRLKSYNNMCILNDRFAKRIQANYELFPVHFTAEELLYLMQGSEEGQSMEQHNMTCIVNRPQYNNNITLNVEVINEFINRFFEIVNGKYTYQDRLYLDSFLIKAGIHNVNHFIKNAVEYVKDTKENAENTLFINKNEQFLTGILKTFIQNRNSRTELVDTYLKNSRQLLIMQFSNKLFRRIFNEDNQKLMAFNTVYQKSSVDISGIIGNLQYQKLELYKENLKQDSIFHESTDVYMQFHTNPYELMWQEAATREKVLEQMMSAFLLNLFDSMELIKEKEAGVSIRFLINQRNNLSDMITSTVLRMISGQNTGIYTIGREEYRELKELKKEQNNIYEQFIERYEKLSQLQGYYDTADTALYDSRNVMQLKENSGSVEKVYRETEADKTEMHEKVIIVKEKHQTEIQEKERSETRTSVSESVRAKESITVQIDKEKARKDTLAALDNPVQVIDGYRRETTDVERYHQKQKELMYEGLPQDSRELFERVEKILEKKAEIELQSMQESAEQTLIQDTNQEQPFVRFEDYEILQLQEIEAQNTGGTDRNPGAEMQDAQMQITQETGNAHETPEMQYIQNTADVPENISEIQHIWHTPDTQTVQRIKEGQNTHDMQETERIRSAQNPQEVTNIQNTHSTQETQNIQNAQNMRETTYNTRNMHNSQEIKNIQNAYNTQDISSAPNLHDTSDISEYYMKDYQIQVLKAAFMKNRYAQNIYTWAVNPENSSRQILEFCESVSGCPAGTTEQTEEKFYETLTYILKEYAGNRLQQQQVGSTIYLDKNVDLLKKYFYNTQHNDTLDSRQNVTNQYSSRQYLEFVQNVLNVSKEFFEGTASTDYYKYSFDTEFGLFDNEVLLYGDTVHTAGHVQGAVQIYGDGITRQGDIVFVYNNTARQEEVPVQPVSSDVQRIENEAQYHNHLTVTDTIRNNTVSQYENSTEQELPQLRDTVRDEINRYETRIEHNIQRSVERTIDSQIANISEKVYGSLEKRLSMERKRRGY